MPLNNDHFNSFLAEADQKVAELDDGNAELIQHLTDLGYLADWGTTVTESSAAIDRATKKFEQELRQSHLYTKKKLSFLELMYASDVWLEVLRKIMDYDEGLCISELPPLGETNLVSRIVHYRLKTYGLFDFQVQHPFGAFSTMALAQLKNFTRLISSVDAINLLADKEKLTRRIIEQHGMEQCILLFNADVSGMPDFNPADYRLNLRFEQKLRNDFDRESSFYQKLNREVLKQNEDMIDWSFVSGRANDDLNLFITRTIQVHQWMDGFYEGKLNGELDTVSLTSIQQMLQFYNLDDADNLKLKEILVYIGRGFFVFNALCFMKHYMIEDVPENNEEKVISDLLVQSQKLSPEKKTAFEENTCKLFEAAQNERSEIQKSFATRVYHGLRSFFKKLFRIGKKLIRWMTEKLDKVWSIMKSFFQKIIEQSKRALKSLVQGIKFLLGRTPLITNSTNKLAISNIEFAGDSLHIIDEHLKSDVLKTHQLAIEKFQDGIQFSIAIVGELFQMLKYLVAGVIGWPLLLLQLAQSIKTVYQKYNLIYTS